MRLSQLIFWMQTFSLKSGFEKEAMSGNILTSTTSQPETFLGGVLRKNSIWQWSPDLPSVKLPSIGAATSFTSVSEPLDQIIVVRRHYSSVDVGSYSPKLEVRQVNSRASSFQLQILQEEPLQASTVRHSLLEQKFNQLAKQWKAETAILSILSKKVIHPAYQRIIGMGDNVIPFLMKELERQPNHWFWALRAITGTNPIKPENRGRVNRMAQDCSIGDVNMAITITHATRQLPNGKWTSKLGDWEDISHELEGIEGEKYGNIYQILKRSL